MLFRSDRKSTRLNSSHTIISYAVFCLKKQRTPAVPRTPPAAPPRPARRQRRVRWGWVGGRGGGAAPGAGRRGGRGRSSFFFLKIGGPTESSPFPRPAPLPF